MNSLYSNYKSNADLAAANSGQTAYYTQFIQLFIPQSRDARILDLGCGGGALLAQLAAMGYNSICGVEQRPEAAQIAELRAGCQVFQTDIFAFLEASDTLFDCIILFDVLEHIDTAKLTDLARLLARHLSEGGVVILHIPNAAGIFGSRIRYSDLTHTLAFTPESIRQFALSGSMSVDKIAEERPVVHGFASLARRVLWVVFSFPFRIILAAETGMLSLGSPLSQNFVAVIKVSEPRFNAN